MASALALVAAGQATVLVALPFTLKVVVQVALLPAASVAVHVTVVTPLLNVEPLTGTQATVGTGQLSAALGALQVTSAVQSPTAVL